MARQKNNNNKKRAELPPRNGGNPGTGRAINVALLVSILFVLVLGISGAIYFDQSRGGQTPHPQAALPPATPGPAAAAKIPPLERINPTAGPALLKATQPGYWVEYAAYLGPDYANQLVKRLDVMGIKAEIVRAQGAGGRQYFSVRSHPEGGRDAAENAALKVSEALDIFPVVHRDGQAQTSSAVFTASIPPASGSTLTYWVQFGAYDIESYAQLYARKLHDSGLDVAVISRQRPSGRVIYYVRSQPLKTPEDALALAQQSQQRNGGDTLIGQTIPDPSPTQHL